MTGLEVKRALRPLSQALRRLAQDQGPRARRNARRAARAALRELGQAIDQSYPAPARKPARRRRGDGAARRVDRVAIASAAEAAALIAAGCRVTRHEFTAYAAEWAIQIWRKTHSPATLRRARLSTQYRRARLAELALLAGEAPAKKER